MPVYDVVIIGSGLGGLECGYILSKEGYKVCILEKNRQFGGSLQIFVRDKAIFDTGIHYIGGLDEGQNLNQSFKYFNIMDKLKLHRMDKDGFDRVTFDY
jgi:all-trans-retinol 13,14-reductase